ncbi:MAG: ATP-binding protein [Bacteroidales bacterium]|nr:ATP-binding protein [Bacteroidales bacterium]MCD8394682.1 ATP-binding protein [Bacteroidales bacterium]
MSDQQPLNPFLIEGYQGEAYFCDREAETASIISALINGRNVTLISPRRMGKTGLIHHAFNRITHDNPNAHVFYIDIFHTDSLRQFVKVMAKAILGTLDTKVERVIAKVVTTLKSVRPMLDTDPITGLPSLGFDIRPGEEQHSLQELFDYLRSSGRRCYVAIDEFQQITQYPEPGVEALLRSYIQFMPNVNFIFSGSRKHLMQEMFTSASRPFYQSTQTLTLKEISFQAYNDFAQGHFQEKGDMLHADAFRYIYDMVKGHTWYIQYWLNRLYANGRSDATQLDARQALQEILKEEDDNFYTYFSTRTRQQQRVLTAIAQEGDVSNPQSTEFLSKYNLPAASTVRSCIKSLVEDDFLLDNRGSFSVYNRFFMLWLRYRKSL